MDREELLGEDLGPGHNENKEYGDFIDPVSFVYIFSKALRLCIFEKSPPEQYISAGPEVRRRRVRNLVHHAHR